MTALPVPLPVSLTRDEIAALEREARVVLAEVEPRNAALERNARLWAASFGEVAVTDVEGRRMAKITRAEWSARWRSDPVPPLPTRGVPNAGGVRPVIAWSPWDDTRESVLDRQPGALWSSHIKTVARKTAYDTAIDLLYEPSAIGAVIEREGEECVSRKVWHRSRATARDYPAERGWCAGLGASQEQAKRGTAAGWRLLCGVLRNVLRETDGAWAVERAEILRAREVAA